MKGGSDDNVSVQNLQKPLFIERCLLQRLQKDQGCSEFSGVDG
jgi:hypothetical protein